jgi:hypothetical protein
MDNMENFSKDFVIDYKYDMDDNDNDDYERELEKQIENNCDFNGYINKLELDEKSDEDLLKMEKYEIIDFKNFQINKLKAYIASLEKEKEDLVENFKTTTNVLLEKIKESDYRDYGQRPQTAQIVSDIQSKNKKQPEKYVEKEMIINDEQLEYNTKLILDNNIQIKRCPNCKKEIPEDKMLSHNLECYRKNITCKICKEIIHETMKKEHLEQYRSKKVI